MHFPGHSSKKEEAANTALTRLNSWFPTTKNPVIISAPMYLIANGTLAAEVSKAGGIGLLPHFLRSFFIQFPLTILIPSPLTSPDLT